MSRLTTCGLAVIAVFGASACGPITRGTGKDAGVDLPIETGDAGAPDAGAPDAGQMLPTLPIVRAKKVITGNGFACALTTTGTIRCWGYPGEVTNSTASVKHSHFGTTVFPTIPADESSNRVQRPVEVPGLTDVVDIQTYYETVCALTAQKKMKCWGRNREGQIGNGTTNGVVTPVEVPLSNVKKMAVGSGHTCALLEDTSVKCWGNASALEDIMVTQQRERFSPLDVPYARGATDIFAGNDVTIIVLNGESRWFGDSLATTDPATPSGNPPRLIPNVRSPTDFKPGGITFVSCAIVAGAAKCWGNPSTDLLGEGSTFGDNPGPGPLQVTGMTSGVTSIDFGAAVKNGKLYRWGKSYLGNGQEASLDSSLVPVEVAGLSNVVQVSNGSPLGSPICAVTSGGSVYCWGENEQGQVGVGSYELSFRSPQKVLWFE